MQQQQFMKDNLRVQPPNSPFVVQQLNGMGMPIESQDKYGQGHQQSSN